MLETYVLFCTHIVLDFRPIEERGAFLLSHCVGVHVLTHGPWLADVINLKREIGKLAGSAGSGVCVAMPVSCYLLSARCVLVQTYKRTDVQT